MADGLSGREAGRLNAEAFEAYLERTPPAQIPLEGGKPNASRIAEACGFDRQVIYKNPRCRAAYERLLEKLQQGGIEARGENGAPGRREEALRSELSAANARIAALSAENRSLKDLVKRLRHVEDHLLETGRLAR